MITAEKFISVAESMVAVRTIYVWGGTGQIVTQALIDAKAKQYQSVYTTAKKSELKAEIGKGTKAIDCSGMLKAIHWGYPNVKYNSGGMPDTSANGYINMCIGVSTDFNKIIPGEVVWMNGHIGLYAGIWDGVKWVIESTPKWKNGVQWVRLDARKWLKHGKMPNVIYEAEVVAQVVREGYGVVSSETLNVRTGPGTEFPSYMTLKKGTEVKIEEYSGRWVKVQAWVSGTYLEQPVVTGTVRTGADNLNVRSGAGTSYPVVEKLANGTKVTLLETSGTWYKIAEGQYIHKDFVDVN